MSSRILRGGEQEKSEAMTWLSVDALEPFTGRTQEDHEAPTQNPEEEIARRLREARQAGFREAEAAGKSRIEAEMERLARTMEALASLRPRLRREAEADLVRLSVAIARRILRREITVDPAALEGLIIAALEKLQAQETHRVRVHPGLEPVLRECLERLGPARNIDVVADPTRGPGTLIFETASGSLDASVETQLQEIERGLADRLRRRS